MAQTGTWNSLQHLMSSVKLVLFHIPNKDVVDMLTSALLTCLQVKPGTVIQPGQ